MATLSAAQFGAILGIPAQTTWQRSQAALGWYNVSCNDWALTAGVGDRRGANVLAAINVDNMAGALGLGVGERRQFLAQQDAGVNFAWRSWAQRQRRKHAGGGKYTTPYMVEKTMKKLIAYNGMIVTAAPTDYYICQHWPIADGVTYEHWWLEARGVVIETFTGNPLRIYGPRRPEQNHYAVVRVGVRELLPLHVQFINAVIQNPQVLPTALYANYAVAGPPAIPAADYYGWS